MARDDLQPEPRRIQPESHKTPATSVQRDNPLPVQGVDQFIGAAFTTGTSYYYVLDLLRIEQPIQVSQSVQDILGLDPAAATVQCITDRIHPDDLAFVSRAEKMAMTILDRDIGMDRASNYKISYCARLRSRDNSYRLFNQQVLILDADDTRGVTRSLRIHTDISHLIDKNNYKLSLLNIVGGESLLNIDVLEKDAKPQATPSPFTRREVEVLRLLAEGRTSIYIASALEISANTVKNHRKNMLRKAECRTTGQLISKCVSEGLI